MKPPVIGPARIVWDELSPDEMAKEMEAQKAAYKAFSAAAKIEDRMAWEGYLCGLRMVAKEFDDEANAGRGRWSPILLQALRDCDEKAAEKAYKSLVASQRPFDIVAVLKAIPPPKACPDMDGVDAVASAEVKA